MLLFMCHCFYPLLIFQSEFVITLTHNWVCIVLLLCNLFMIAIFFILHLFYCLVSVILVLIKIFMVFWKQESILHLFKSYFVTMSMKTIIMSASICTCLRELYFMLYNAYYYWTMTCRYWNFSWLDILFHKEKSLLCFNHDFLYFFYNLFLSIFALKAGYIELNSQPKKKSNSYFSCYHWNVKSLPTKIHCKVAAWKAHNSIYKYDFFVLMKFFLIPHLNEMSKISW